MGDDRGLVDASMRGRFDQRGDGLAETLVGHADHCCIDDGRVLLQHFLDFLWEDLLAAGVDALAAAAIQAKGSVGFDLGPIARDAPTNTLKRDERGR